MIYYHGTGASRKHQSSRFRVDRIHPPPLLSIMSVMWHFLPALEVYTLISRPTFNYMTPWPKANGRVVG